MAEAEAAYAHLVDVLERSVVHTKLVLASCLSGLLNFRGQSGAGSISCSHVDAALMCTHGQILHQQAACCACWKPAACDRLRRHEQLGVSQLVALPEACSLSNTGLKQSALHASSHGISDAQGHAHMTKMLKRFLNARETMLEDHIAGSSREGMSVVEKSRVERDASLAVDAALANVLMESGLRDIHGRQHMVRTLHSVLTEDEVSKSGTKEDPVADAGAARLAPDPPKSSQQGRQFLNDEVPSPVPSQQVPVPPQEQRQSSPVNDNEQLIRL